MEELITELLFADDCALVAHTERALQHIGNRFSDAAKNFSLTISLKKTEVLYQPPPREVYNPPHISIDGTKLNAVEHFNYLSNVFSMPQSARILTSACPKPAVPWEDCQRGYGRVTRSASPQRQLHIHCRTSSYPLALALRHVYHSKKKSFLVLSDSLSSLQAFLKIEINGIVHDTSMSYSFVLL